MTFIQRSKGKVVTKTYMSISSPQHTLGTRLLYRSRFGPALYNPPVDLHSILHMRIYFRSFTGASIVCDLLSSGPSLAPGRLISCSATYTVSTLRHIREAVGSAKTAFTEVRHYVLGCFALPQPISNLFFPPCTRKFRNYRA